MHEEIVSDLCGQKSFREQSRRFRRAGSTYRTLKRKHGKISFKLAKVYSKETGSSMRPLLLFLSVERRKRSAEDLVLECAETATYLTHPDSRAVIENLTLSEVSRQRIHDYVQRAGSFMNEERCDWRRTATARWKYLNANNTQNTIVTTWEKLADWEMQPKLCYLYLCFFLPFFRTL